MIVSEKNCIQIINKLVTCHDATKDELIFLLEHREQIDDNLLSFLFASAQKTASLYYGKKIYLRGLIEISSFCKNDCYYCGLRRSNKSATRYRLSEDEILACVTQGSKIGLHTFVLQGGEDDYWNADNLVPIIKKIKKITPTSAVTLSLGEMSSESYRLLFEAGANRYLLRHEAISEELYAKLHPAEMKLQTRLTALNNLKEIGYQTGSGFMVGRPFETVENVADDLIFLKNFAPQMVGIGPFIPQMDTPFGDKICGTSDNTIFLLAIIRLLLPSVLLPATTALATIDESGYEKAILAGANVIMPNLTPQDARCAYRIYDGKANACDTVSQIGEIKERLAKIGYAISLDRGDAKRIGDIKNG